MVNVDVYKDPEHPGEDLLTGLLEALWEVGVGVPGEDGLVVDLVADPLEQEHVVGGGGHCRGFLKKMYVSSIEQQIHCF